jgi:hypothetical protein
MKVLNTTLSGLLIVISVMLLFGCKSEPEASASVTRIQTAQQFKKDVELKLEQATDSESVALNVFLLNPSSKAITSYQLWLSYKPEDLRGVKMDVNEDLFPLTAPYKTGFVQEKGLLKLGRATESPVNSERIKVATIEFEKMGEGAAMIEAYDYQIDLSGHTSVNTVQNGVPYNILKQPGVPLLIIN